MFGVGLLGIWKLLVFVYRDIGLRLWRLEEELVGFFKDLEDD